MKCAFRRIVSFGLILAMTLLLLSGCSNNSDQKQEITSSPTAVETIIPTPESTPEIEELNPETAEPKVGNIESVFHEPTVLTSKQANSINMLNYLAALTREILAKNNSRVFVETTYNSLINDINPSKVDELTQSHFNELLDDLHEFEKLLTKRDRLKYLFEQNQAQAMRSAIPNPLGLLSAVKSVNLFSLVASVAYMAIDAVSSYTSAMSSAEQEFLQDTWALDDEEKDTIHSLRKQTFMYMLEVVREYDLPDALTLSEEKVDSFVEWKERSYDISSPASKVLYYQNHEAEYEGFGQYWLARAVAHYDNKEYENCLKAIGRYEDLKIGIFRKDYELAKVLPLAVSSAKEVYQKEEYINAVAKYADFICKNTSVKDWSLRYFAAQTYIDLYDVSKDKAYINKAYDIVLNNVNELKTEQRNQNTKYLAPVEQETIPNGVPNEKVEATKRYNEQLKKNRETELPPIYEPLRLNCDLLFAIMDEFDYGESDRKKVEQVLFDGNDTLFLIKALNDKYLASQNTPEISIDYSGRDIKMPASLVSSQYAIRVIVTDKDNGLELLDDWTITKVERPVSAVNVADNYVASFHSKKAESYNFANATRATIEIYPLGDETSIYYTAGYDINNSKTLIFFDNVSFTESK